MRDRTEEVRAVVEKYDGFKFIPLRIEDAFDSSWWAKMGRKPLKSDLALDLANEGILSLLHSLELRHLKRVL